MAGMSLSAADLTRFMMMKDANWARLQNQNQNHPRSADSAPWTPEVVTGNNISPHWLDVRPVNAATTAAAAANANVIPQNVAKRGRTTHATSDSGYNSIANKAPTSIPGDYKFNAGSNSRTLQVPRSVKSETLPGQPPAKRSRSAPKTQIPDCETCGRKLKNLSDAR